MIPKTIHYCWFGRNPKPEGVQKCIDSWKKYLTDYEIKEWNEENFDIHINKYCEQAYNHRKWAFVSDVARVIALYHEGGIYFDTDVEVVQSFNPLLHQKAFLGFEGTQWIATSTMGTEPGNPIIKQFIDNYNTRNFENEEGHLDLKSNVRVLTKMLIDEQGLILNGKEQQLKDFHIFPTEFFTPFDYINGKLRKTTNTYSIHWFDQSWIGQKPWRVRISQWYHRLIGSKMK